jgi:hypothetical protein
MQAAPLRGNSALVAPERLFVPRDAVSEAIKATLITGGAGLMLSAVQNTLTKQNVSAWGVFTRTGGTIGVFGVYLAAPRTWVLKSC